MVKVEKAVAVAEIEQTAVLECHRLDVAAHFLLGQVLEQWTWLGIMIGVNVELQSLCRWLEPWIQRIGNAVRTEINLLVVSRKNRIQVGVKIIGDLFNGV